MMMMCSRCLTALLSLLVACAVEPGESTTSSDVVSVNRVAANRVAANRIELNRISLDQLAGHRLSGGRMMITPQAQNLLATDDGREVLSLVVSCAVPLGITLVGTVNGAEFDLLGEIGLAPQWLSSPLDRVGQHWVSACMFARVSGLEVVIPISMRGRHPQLATSAAERAEWTLEEAAFYGDAFGPLDQPLRWFACRGRDKAAGDAGELADRECAAPDPAHPGFTLCGMIFAGDCGSFAPDQACESFSTHGTFYERCHTSPLRDRDDDRDDDDDAQVFNQVITTFVTP
jgi:hypothetical protein